MPVKFSAPLVAICVFVPGRWMIAAEDATRAFQMEGTKDAFSNKGIAERLTLGIIRILGMYSV